MNQLVFGPSFLLPACVRPGLRCVDANSARSFGFTVLEDSKLAPDHEHYLGACALRDDGAIVPL